MLKSPRRLALLSLWMLPLSATLMGCEHLTATRATEANSVCAVWKPVIYSRLHDTAETIAQVKSLNAAHDALCGH